MVAALCAVWAPTGCEQLARLPSPARPCIECHEADRARPQSPDHLAADYPTDCGSCHSQEGWNVGVMKCSACHGSEANDAPPKGVSGETDPSTRAVGAHQEHLRAADWHAPMRCEDCHVVPATVDQPGHRDNELPAEVTFTGIARADGASPAWDGARCSGTYCHGATLSGGATTAPVWTQQGGAQVACGSCHGLPPSDGHEQNPNCYGCHPTVDANRKIIAPAQHIDGFVQAAGKGHPDGYGEGSVHGPDFFATPQVCTVCHGATLDGGTAKSCASAGCHDPGWKTDCTRCHGGTDTQTGAPPAAVDGATSTSVPGVGRHTSHTTTGASHAAYECKTCHQVPTDVLSPGHIGPSPAELTFTGLAQGSRYDASTHTCSGVYCHGDGRGAGGSAVWTGTLSGGCGACHAETPPSGRHRKHVVDKKYSCATCHSCVVNASKQVTDPARHVDGKKDVCGQSGWNPATRRCTPTCHEGESW